MTERQPADEEERQQIREKLATTLFVEAGAGTGKTHELVQRLVRLVASGAELRRIAAITFTEAAAAELRDRVRQELERAAEGALAYGWMTGDQRTRCAAAADSIDTAAIQTLHSFAQRILSLHPLEAGLPPRISISDDMRASLQFEDRWKEFEQKLLDDPSAEVEKALFRAQMLGLAPRHLRSLALSLHNDWDRLERVAFEVRPLPDVDPSPILEALAEVFALASTYTGGTGDRLWQYVEELRDFGEKLQKAGQAIGQTTGDEQVVAESNLFRQLGKLPTRNNGWGTKGNWGDLKADFHAAAKRVEDAAAAFMWEIRSACLGPLLRELQRFVMEYRDERIAEATLEFHDLLVLARNLLRDSEAVRSTVHGRFDHILIDEFQDTDPLQIQIAARIAAGGAPAETDGWAQMPIPAGRLFFVGDPKQSIYRFRRADIDLYQSVQERFGSDGIGVTAGLTQNFRTVKEIIDWSNAIFETLFGQGGNGASDGSRQTSQVRFQKLQEWREIAPGAGPAVTILGQPVNGDDGLTNTERLRAREAADVADAVQRIRGNGGPAWQVFDKAKGTWRAARYQDITILLPTRTTLPAIEKGLARAGIPLRVEARSLLFQTQDVRDLVSILAAIDDPTDAVAVVAALRSPGFACGDDDLYDYKRARGGWNYLAPIRDETESLLGAEHPVPRGMRSLAALHAARLRLSVSALIDHVIRDRQLFELAFAMRRPRETWARLRFVQEQARAFVDAGGTTLRQFVQWMRRQADEDSRVVESVVPEEDDDAVRIMTVHASKGLEFPIVLLAGLNTKGNNQTPNVLWGEHDQPEVHIGAEKYGVFESDGYQALKKYEQAMERLEDDRLLYVAATRARDHLVISLWHKAPGKGDHAERHREGKCQTAAECLYAVCQEHKDLWQPFPADELEENAPPEADGTLDSPAEHEAWAGKRDALIREQQRRRRFGATAVAKEAAGAAEEDGESDGGDDEAPWRRGRSGTSVGRAVHAVLQTIDLESGAGIEDAARAQAAAEGVAGREGEIAKLARSAVASQAVREAVAAGRYWREVYVAAPVGDVTIEGFIDLLYEGTAGLVVVDYKTDATRGEADADAKLERYRLQGAAYALAIQETLKRPVARCVFVFVDEHEAHERAIADLAAAITEVRTFAATAAAAV